MSNAAKSFNILAWAFYIIIFIIQKNHFSNLYPAKILDLSVYYLKQNVSYCNPNIAEGDDCRERLKFWFFENLSSPRRPNRSPYSSARLPSR